MNRLTTISKNLMVWGVQLKWLVKRRHTHSQERRLPYLCDYGNEISELVRPRGLEQSEHGVFGNTSDSELNVSVSFSTDSRLVLRSDLLRARPFQG